jgi:hypothetical protein
MNMIQKIENIVQYEEIDIPSALLNYLEKKTRRTPYFRKSRYYVTDIVGCQRKSHYKAMQFEEEDLLNDATVESMWDSVRGDLLHQITYAYKWRKMDIEHYVPLKDGTIATVTGRLDMYDWKTATIIDLKSNGTYQQISEWKTVGAGEPKADEMVRRCWKDNIKMKGFAELGYCTIKYIEEREPESTVGVGGKNPSIKYLKDGGEIDVEPDPNEFGEFENNYESYKQKFEDISF